MSIDAASIKARSLELGFLACQPTWPSFVDLFGRLRKERIIP